MTPPPPPQKKNSSLQIVLQQCLSQLFTVIICKHDAFLLILAIFIYLFHED